MSVTTSFEPRSGTQASTTEDTTAMEVGAAAARAAAAAVGVAAASPATRSSWLDTVADTLETHVDELAALAVRETALGLPRLTQEVGRAAAQLRFYGAVAVEGSYLDVRIDEATPTAPRIVRVNRPLGPVAVFGASNFPFGFGVLGNDTASALAAGCPVVVKAHPAHLLTCLRLVELAVAALDAAGAPGDTLQLVSGLEAGAELVRAPEMAAVGFTGSQRGGLALWRLANERPEVIPVYAEMGTVNPAVLTPAGAADRLAEVATGFVSSFTLGSGQFCTKPGLLLAPRGYGVPAAVAEALAAASPTPVMLTEAMADAVATALRDLQLAGATVIGTSAGPGAGWSADAAVLCAPTEALQPGSRLLEECFGPVALVVEYEDLAELGDLLGRLQGSLAGTVVPSGPDDPDTAVVVATLAERVGRVTVGDWPTGVAWTWAQQHGGPWPATSQPASTSVGAAALERFVRPVAYQSVPDDALPAPVRAAVDPTDPWQLPRRVDGVRVRW
jgi:NADP-dependent aldehyde dehydrogenase